MADAAIHGHDHEDNRSFFVRWFMSTNHKDIGILYLFTAAFFGFISVLFTVYMRMELMNPGVQYMCLEGARLIADATAECTPNGHLWNVLITGHGILMMFFVVIPALFGGFGNKSVICDRAAIIEIGFDLNDFWRLKLGAKAWHEKP